MTPRIIILTNTFPYSGEQFLRTELETLKQNMNIDLWTFFPSEGGKEPLIKRNNVADHVFSGNPTRRTKIIAFMRSLGNLCSKGELFLAAQKKGFIRNVIKAIKFGYISELRVSEIAIWIDTRFHNTNNNLILYSYWMYEVAYVAARLKQLVPRVKFVTRCHRYDLYESCHKNGYLPYRRYILDSADLIFPISTDGKEHINRLFGKKYDSKIEIMRLGTIRPFQKADVLKKEDEVVIVSCSNLIPVKRVEKIAEALKQCKRKVTWYHFGDGVTKEIVRYIVDQFPNNIHGILKGFIPNIEIQKFYSEHDIDVFINVSDSEGVPVSIMEAQSYGIPVIATDVGGTSEIVHNGENGVLLDLNFTSEDLLKALEVVLLRKKDYAENALMTWNSLSNAENLFNAFYKRLNDMEMR